MKIIRFSGSILLIALLSACNGRMTVQRSGLFIEVSEKKQLYTLDESIDVQLKNPKGLVLTKVNLFFEKQPIIASQDNSVTISLADKKVGRQNLIAAVVVGEDTLRVTKRITLVGPNTPKLYTYKVLNEYPHDRDAYTQGLEFHHGTLYESTGQYGESSLRKLNYLEGTVETNVPLSKNIFGEGLTILNNKLYQLTWKANTGFIYNLETLEREGSFAYGNSRQGWGLCNDGQKLYKSDGTEKIWTLDPETLVEEDFIQVYTNKKKIPSLNELEWVDGKIYANIYQQNGVAIINPASGVVEGVIDFSPLKKEVAQHDELDVLNGIAFNKDTGTLFVTGKNWDKLFEVEVMEK